MRPLSEGYALEQRLSYSSKSTYPATMFWKRFYRLIVGDLLCLADTGNEDFPFYNPVKIVNFASKTGLNLNGFLHREAT